MDTSNFNMNQVLNLLKNLDAKYVNGFFSYRDLNGREVYRIASGLNPGLLEADTETHVLLMALDLNQANDQLLLLWHALQCPSDWCVVGERQKTRRWLALGELCTLHFLLER